MLPPALPILNAFLAVFIAPFINYNTRKAKSAFPPYARPAPFVVVDAFWVSEINSRGHAARARAKMGLSCFIRNSNTP